MAGVIRGEKCKWTEEKKKIKETIFEKNAK